ncbi:MAG: hypothetical protein SFW35_10765 [Chitinophagales bacterium]|nr:hypothetical protein [Chitinophagales bacterium]
MDQTYNLVDALKVLIKWRKPIFIFTGVATLISLVVVLLLPNYYESKSVFYPSNPAANDRQALFGQSGGESQMEYFGTKNDVNRFITIANSSPLLDFAINYYNLPAHYDIDTTKKAWRYKAKKKLLSNMSILKTEFGAIEITFMDRDPVLAATVVNGMVEVIDKLNKEMIIGNKENILTVFQEKIKEKTAEVNALTDSVAFLGKTYNIVEVSPATDKSTGIVTGNDPTMVAHYKVLKSRLDNALIDLNTISTLYDQHDASSKQQVSTIYIVEKAFPSEKKAWPLRSLIVASTAIIALFLAIVGALLIDQASAIKKQLNAQSVN